MLKLHLKFGWFWLGSISLGLIVWARPGLANQLDYWRFNPAMSRLEIVTEGTVRPRVQLISNPTRLVVDLPNTQFGRPKTQRSIGNFVREVRVGQFTPQMTRIVIELGSRFNMRSQEVRVRGLAPNRWFVQLPKFLSVSELPANPKPIAISVPNPPPYPRARIVIAVDPGHGGPDPGAVGINGLQEKFVTLDISQRLAHNLQQRGIQAVLTRTDDRDLDLAPRVLRASQVQARAFVSIHANAFTRADVNGVETYYYATGLPLAQAIHRSILNRLPMRDRGVKRANFYVLRQSTMPAVLVEVGFVSGREDAPRLAQASFRQSMATAIGDGLVNHFRGLGVRLP